MLINFIEFYLNTTLISMDSSDSLYRIPQVCLGLEPTNFF